MNRQRDGHRMSRRFGYGGAAVLLLLPTLGLLTASDADARWGEKGHEMAAHAAANGLPAEMPLFFRSSAAQLTYLNPEPDRWRNRDMGEMDQAFSYDHYTDLENLPDGALDAPNRWEYLALLYDAGLEKPERDAGFLVFHMIELHQRLVTQWRLWSAASGAEQRFIEQRILNDAGTLGHYVTDASQPHHTTIHFNGWNASGSRQVANPEGFTEERDFHGRFETAFVGANVEQPDVDAAMRAPRPVEDARGYVIEHFLESHGEVERLYRLELQYGFQPFEDPHPDEVAFAAERLAAGASALRDLWVAAWLEGTGRTN
jgi:hypothetical protein